MKEKLPAISVVVPVYNTEQYIERCINSMVIQLHEGDELILVDDGSEDGSGAICDEYANTYSQVKTVHQVNAGEGAARNRGMKLAEGDYIVFVDADDQVDSCLFQTIIQNMDDSMDFLLLGMVTDTGSSQEKQCPDTEVGVYFAEDRDLLIQQCFYGRSEQRNIHLRSACAKAFRTSFLRENKICFPEKVIIGPDMLFMLRVYSCMNKAKYCSKTVYHYFFHNPTSVTNKYKPELKSILQGYVEAITPWLEKYPEYKSIHSWYRLNDIILYMKFDFFHPQNRESPVALHTRMEKILREGRYREYYELAKRNRSLKKYGYAKRFTFWCYVKGYFRVLRLLYLIKYRNGRR